MLHLIEYWLGLCLVQLLLLLLASFFLPQRHDTPTYHLRPTALLAIQEQHLPHFWFGFTKALLKTGISLSGTRTERASGFTVMVASVMSPIVSPSISSGI